ncbi:MAG TPA: hypothetical protein V6D08_15505 [Candidatus Obscuribacterales bacterium]
MAAVYTADQQMRISVVEEGTLEAANEPESGRACLPRTARVQSLPTGDMLAEYAGSQTLFMPDQGTLVIAGDGNAHLRSGRIIHAWHKDGVATIVFPGYDYVRLDRHGVICIVRGQKIAMLRQPLVPPVP